MSTTENRRHAPPQDFEEDPRYRIAGRESLVCIAYWFLFTAGAVVIAWLLGNRDSSEIGFVLGFPDWFFWSALAYVGVFSLIVPFVMVKLFFKDMDLEPVPAPGTPGAEEEGR